MQRKNMVEGQIRPSDVTDRRIMAAMTAIPREIFVPIQLRDLAYSDETLRIAPRREILPPRVLAKLVQLADFQATENVLVISEVGYAAALVAELAGKVVALLPDDESAKTTAEALASLALNNAVSVAGPFASGWQSNAPYDVVLVEGGIERVPDAIGSQIRDNGRLVGIAVDERIGRAVVMHKRADVFARRDDFQAAAPLLSGFAETRPAFVF